MVWPFKKDDTTELGLFNVMFLTAYADGKVVEEERHLMAKIIHKLKEFKSFTPEILDQAIVKRIERVREEGPKLMVSELPDLLKTKEIRIRALELSARIVKADNIVDKRELKLLNAIRNTLDVPKDAAKRIIAPLLKEAGQQPTQPGTGYGPGSAGPVGGPSMEELAMTGPTVVSKKDMGFAPQAYAMSDIDRKEMDALASALAEPTQSDPKVKNWADMPELTPSQHTMMEQSFTDESLMDILKGSNEPVPQDQPDSGGFFKLG
jgi:tellurite resistance protein